MFYIRFVWWLTRKVNYWEVKRIYGNTGVYDRLDDTRTQSIQPLSSLVPLALYGLPFIGYLYLVMEVLPFSSAVRVAILMGSLGGSWFVAVVILIRKAKRR